MNNLTPFSTPLIITGIVLIGLGLLISGKLGPLGRLPGDIVIERQSFTLYIPIATMLLISLLISLVAWLMRR